jgi:hypothetical protein
MISKQILQYKEKFSKPQIYKVDYANNCLINTLTNEKIDLKISFPFKPALFYNGFTDEYFVYTFATYFGICSMLNYDSQEFLIDIDTSHSVVLFYTVPNLKVIGILKGSFQYAENDCNPLHRYNKDHMKTYFPVSNTVIAFKTRSVDKIQYLGNIPVIETEPDIYIITKNDNLHVTKLYANNIYENVFLVRYLNMPTQIDNQSIALTDLHYVVYMQTVTTDNKIIYNVSI